MSSSHRYTGRAVPPTSPVTRPVDDDGGLDTTDGNQPGSRSECVGPVALPPYLTRVLRSPAGADDSLPLWICASVLAARLSPADSTLRARVIHGTREVTVPVAGQPWRPTDSFRAALRRAGRFRVESAPTTAAGGSVDMTILLSQDSHRLYVESMTSATVTHLPECWARSFVLLLAGVAYDPDAPMTGHLLEGVPPRAGGPPLVVPPPTECPGHRHPRPDVGRPSDAARRDTTATPSPARHPAQGRGAA
ncbi:hypothetical protein GA0070622_2712 [Micromonospora sediminicola]|uniref:Uncharacterized protein n=1 Tax=Micromonospora sediminicola TaxID=946078 RepID=A0A1A9B9Y1_9ACTN|nr:hypothetical protein GA0070622_2712 [Micromonospora sediminicola]